MHWQLHCPRCLRWLGADTVRLRLQPGTLQVLVAGEPPRYCVDFGRLPADVQTRALPHLAQQVGLLSLADATTLCEQNPSLVTVAACGQEQLSACLDGDGEPTDVAFIARGSLLYRKLLQIQRAEGLTLTEDQVQRMLRERDTLLLWLGQPQHQWMSEELMQGVALIEEVRNGLGPARPRS